MNKSQYLTGTGKIIYDPNRGKMKAKTKWWCVVNVDREITRYYRWFVKRHYFGRTAIDENWLCKPAWDAHISVVRGEKPHSEFMEYWKSRHGQTITFTYKPHPRWAGDTTGETDKSHFWFIDCQSDDIMEIRKELGLKTFYKFHITIGRTYY